MRIYSLVEQALGSVNGDLFIERDPRLVGKRLSRRAVASFSEKVENVHVEPGHNQARWKAIQRGLRGLEGQVRERARMGGRRLPSRMIPFMLPRKDEETR